MSTLARTVAVRWRTAVYLDVRELDALLRVAGQAGGGRELDSAARRLRRARDRRARAVARAAR